MDEEDDKKFESYRKAFVIQALRRASFRWPSRNEAKKRAKISYGLYRCQSCKAEIKPKQIKMDHIEPVVNPITGFEGWDQYVLRMFCKSSGFQVICTECHDAKSFTEKEMRKEYRKKRAKPLTKLKKNVKVKL